MAREGEMVRKLRGKKERREKIKTVEFFNGNVAMESGGKKKRRKREAELGSTAVCPVDLVDKVNPKKRDEAVSKNKKKWDGAHGEETSRLGQSKTEEEIVNGIDYEDASTSSGKKKKKKKSRKHSSSNQGQQLKQEGTEAVEDDVLYMSSGDEDSSTGMKKWLTEYHDQRPGFEILQQRIDDFIVAHEERIEQERKQREARIAEEGWTVVEHHKGRKKTTDAESGIAVGSVAQAAVLDKLAKKKQKGVGPNFYRFQKREAQRNQVIMLQSKFEEDKKRIQQLRAARKFRPY